MTLPHLDDAQRRARLVARHHLGLTAANVLDAVRDLVAVHSSDPITPALALWARIPGFEASHLEDALYEDRSLWRLHAMRRTLWVTAADEAALFEAAAGRKVAAAECKRLVGWLEQVVPADEVEAWLSEVRSDVRAALARAKGKFTTELTDAVPALGTKLVLGKGKWAQETPVSTRLLYVMAMELELVRGRPKGTWRGSQYAWERADNWFGDNLDVLQRQDDEEVARTALAGKLLARFGPMTRDDLKWFMGWTVPQTVAALEANGAVEVQLDRRETGWVLPDDVDPVPVVENGTVALLPGLDPTPMGWKGRKFFLGPHEARVFDDTGNIGPTVWVDGKVVGGWAVQPSGRVAVELLEDVGQDAEAAVVERAAELTEWLDGQPITSRFPSQLEKELRTASG